MNEDPPPLSADRMPTLTEVVEFIPTSPEVPAAMEQAPMPDSQALVHEVLAALQPRIDMLFESRLREALAPALARAAEALIREARTELGSVLHELVDDAVKRALQRHGGRS